MSVLIKKRSHYIIVYRFIVLVARSENLSNQLVKELKQFEFINNF